jgi:hypothetical protein
MSSLLQCNEIMAGLRAHNKTEECHAEPERSGGEGSGVRWAITPGFFVALLLRMTWKGVLLDALDFSGSPAPGMVKVKQGKWNNFISKKLQPSSV